MFGSKKLNKLYENGALNEVMNHFNLTKKNLLGSGGDASAFKYNDNEVIKICAKKNDHFKNDKCALDFAKISQKYKNVFLPVNKLLYEDENVFIYTQYYCQQYNGEIFVEKMLKELLTVALTMLKHTEIQTNLSPHNLSFYNGKLMVFDYHALTFVNWNNKDIFNEEWFKILIIHLYGAAATFYCPKYRRQIKDLLKKGIDKKTYNYILKIEKLPKCWMKLLNYIVEHNDNLKSRKICKYIQKCIEYY